MRATIIEWDGTHLPVHLRQLPPGRYLVESVEGLDDLTPEEDAGIRAALDDLDTGNGVLLTIALEEILTGRRAE